MRALRSFSHAGLCLVFALLLSACQALIADYSVEAYKNATSLKAETLAMIDKSGEPYSRHRNEVEALTVKIDAAYEFAAGMPNNALAAQQWAIVRDPNRDLYGGYVRDWRTDGPVNETFRAEKKMQIGRAFDYIICLEANKQRASRCGVPTQ
jgi:hypothetical protein